MATQLTPSEWLAILNNPELTHAQEKEFLQLYLTREHYQAHAGEIVPLMAKPVAVGAINSGFIAYAKRIAKYQSIQFAEDKTNKIGHSFWNFFFDGWEEKPYFIWRLRPELAEALTQLPALPDRESFISPEEMSSAETEGYPEGAKKRITVNAYERNRKARDQCLAHYGYDCAVCGMNFEKVYGRIGKKFIHVHHLKPVSANKKSYKVDPIRDLRPVCPNCHAMLHTRQSKPYSIEELKAIMKKAAQAKA